MHKNRLLIALSLLVLASLACNAVMGAKNPPDVGAGEPAATEEMPLNVSPTDEITPTEEAMPAEETPSEEPPSALETPDDATKFDTEFPVPAESSGFMDMGSGGVNFQTKISIDEAIAFYREAFKQKGYKERELLTANTKTTFSMVFDGHDNGKAIVIQGVDLANGSININIRFEDV